MQISSAPLGAVTVPYPQDDDPRHGGGPIRRAYGYMTQSDYGMKYDPSVILRTPHGVSPDEGSGETWPPVLATQKMLPDGRIVNRDSLRGMDGFGLSFESKLALGAGLGLLAGSLVAGSLLGALFAQPGARLRGLGKGMLMGGSTVAWIAGNSALNMALQPGPTVAGLTALGTGAGIGATAGALYGTPGARGRAMAKGAVAGLTGTLALAIAGLGGAMGLAAAGAFKRPPGVLKPPVPAPYAEDAPLPPSNI
jgi:hypothetical protein